MLKWHVDHICICPFICFVRGEVQPPPSPSPTLRKEVCIHIKLLSFKFKISFETFLYRPVKEKCGQECPKFCLNWASLFIPDSVDFLGGKSWSSQKRDKQHLLSSPVDSHFLYLLWRKKTMLYSVCRQIVEVLRSSGEFFFLFYRKNVQVSYQTWTWILNFLGLSVCTEINWMKK